MGRLLTYDPKRRLDANTSLEHKWFSESPLPVDPSMFPTWPARSEQPARKHNSPKPPSGGKAYAKLMVSPPSPPPSTLPLFEKKEFCFKSFASDLARFPGSCWVPLTSLALDKI